MHVIINTLTQCQTIITQVTTQGHLSPTTHNWPGKLGHHPPVTHLKAQGLEQLGKQEGNNAHLFTWGKACTNATQFKAGGKVWEHYPPPEWHPPPKVFLGNCSLFTMFTKCHHLTTCLENTTSTQLPKQPHLVGIFRNGQ